MNLHQLMDCTVRVRLFLLRRELPPGTLRGLFRVRRRTCRRWLW